MKFKVTVLVIIVSIVMILGLCTARPVQLFSYEKMASEADIVVIASPIQTKQLDEYTNLPGVSQGNMPIKVVGLETTFAVSVIFRGKLDKAQNSSIILHYYQRLEKLDPNKPQVNEVQLLNFKPDDNSQYLMFLKRTDDGRYEPFNGQTDPIYSIEKLRMTKLTK